MSFRDLEADIDASVREHLCDPAEVRPAGGGPVLLVSVMIDDDLESRGLDINAPVRAVVLRVHRIDHVVRKGDVFLPGRMVAGIFSPDPTGWRATGPATREGDWQKVNVEPYQP